MTYTTTPSLNGSHPPQTVELLDPLPDEPRTELGYARRLIHVHQHELRYVATWKQWLIWDQTRWAPDTKGRTKRWMKTIARNVTTDTLNKPADKEQRQRTPRNQTRRNKRSHQRSPQPRRSRLTNRHRR